MILVSNNLQGMSELRFCGNVVIRINIAWANTVDDLKAALIGTEWDVFIDYPEGRTKPPAPRLLYSQVIEVIEDFPQVKYFAVSNIESPNVAGLYARSLEHIKFVPKIETYRGAWNIAGILKEAHPEYIMLDTEDLFLSCGGDARKYTEAFDHVKFTCEKNGVSVLKIQGVVFGEI